MISTINGSCTGGGRGQGEELHAGVSAGVYGPYIKSKFLFCMYSCTVVCGMAKIHSPVFLKLPPRKSIKSKKFLLLNHAAERKVGLSDGRL